MSNQSRTTVFWTSTAILFFGLWITLGVALGLAERAGLGHNLVGKTGIAGGPIFFLAFIGATMIRRVLRISAESTTREVLTQPIHVDLSEPLEVRTAQKRWRELSWISLPLAGISVATVWTSLPLRPHNWWVVPAAALFIAMFAHCVYKAIVPGPPVVRLDSDTVFTGLWHRTIAWDQVRSCEIITHRNVFANIARITFKLYDEHHKLLMKGAFVPPIQPAEERLFSELRSRFSHLEVTSQPQVPAHESGST